VGNFYSIVIPPPKKLSGQAQAHQRPYRGGLTNRIRRGSFLKTVHYIIYPFVMLSASAFAAVSVTSPLNGAAVSSPAHYVATATTTTCAKGVASMGIYVNNVKVYVVKGHSLDYELPLASGAEHTVVEEWDYCGGASTKTLNVTVKGEQAGPTVSITATPASVSPGSSSTLTVAATNASKVAITGSDGSSFTLTGSGGTLSVSPMATTSYTATASGTAGKSSAVAIVSVTTKSGGGGIANVLTWHFDAQRTGLNPDEKTLSPSNVNAQGFGKLFSYLVNGYVYGQPLLVSNVTIAGGLHNVLYVATESDQVYALDADSYSNPLWHISLLRSGEKPKTTGEIQPYEGVTSTPVIDLASKTMYVVSTQTGSGGSTFRLNALDITSGAQKFGGPMTIEASVAATNSDSVKGVQRLNTSCIQRAALLLANETVFIGFGSCHSGWLLAYDAQTLSQTGVFNASPNLNGEGKFASAGGVWMGGGGPAADEAGNIYITTGNGPWDGKTAWSDSMLKFNSRLQMEDYFTPYNYQFMDCRDGDLASGGLLLIPGTSEAVAGGKTGKLYLINTLDMGKEQANDAGAKQTLWFDAKASAPYSQSCTDSMGVHTAQIGSYEIYSTAAYFNGSLYLGVQPTSSHAPAGVGQFKYSGTLTPEDYTTLNITENGRGTTPFISANGTASGILWMIDHGQPLGSPAAPTKATLHAYNAENLADELYSSATKSADVPGYGIKFTSPIVANGKVYISTGHDLVNTSNPEGELDVYGLK
jgi:hypothetical protein